MTDHRPVPLSVLDLAPVRAGGTGAEALRDAVARAQLVERLDYRRVWYAEHHLAGGVASAAPAVLAALVASATSTIRVGSAAVLLGSTSPVVAAEQFGTVAALHPGRVDLGLGRASFPPPSVAGGAGAPAPAPRRRPEPTPERVVGGLLVPATPPVSFGEGPLLDRILAQHRFVGAGRTPGAFADELSTLLDVVRGTARTDADRPVTVPAAQGSDLALWVLASSGGESARVAGELGLPLGANYHVSPSTVLETVEQYRAAFRPGVLDAPYVVVSADVLAADTATRAHALADPFAEWVLSIRRGEGAIPYPAPGTTTPWAQRPAAERDLVRDRVDTRFVGTADEVAAGLATLARATGADELLLTTITHDPADTARSYELLAQAWPSTTEPTLATASA
ncbi:LLM class flavin-dependent oxidoreductase [Cellulomonas sp.]|uniref:LLM class flavin-dependent oxidoreductase n=1 Tax=Cellulomonas sp. TaxID=40001 RepID=UPI001B0AA3FD|nr:LLM class flavin-dependent oxidoreductase [Cellulomonas sp.]MBO9556468.1 LLM class flavin-dependent oxidoreductase [Cellulomonas sp.]